MCSLQFAVQFVERTEIGFGRGYDNVGIGAVAVNDAARLLQSHRHLALRVGAAGDGVNRKQLQLGAAAQYLFNCPENGIHRATAI